MMQLTIEPRKDANGQTANGLELGLPTHRGVAVPLHMKAPGEEGYRTPTIEDYERHRRESRQQNQQNQQAERPLTGHSESAPHGEKQRPFTSRPFNLSNLSLNNQSMEKLAWKERVRHYTWT